jgi:ribonuclease VapC
MSTRRVLDASAVLAWLQQEPGADRVDPLLPHAAISTVNWAEVLQKVAQRGRDPDDVGSLLQALGLRPIPLSADEAAIAAGLWQRASSLSLGDRCCLALATRLELPAVTADRDWLMLDTGAPVESIR